jgi:lipopolysaccharide export system protein LptA
VAALRPDPRRRASTRLSAAVSLVLLAGSLGAAEPPGEIQIEADGLQLDYAANTLRMPNIVIRQDTPQGSLLIRAAEATARGTEPSFQNSQWKFSGSVHIEYLDGVLDADTAQLTFADNRLQQAVVDGNPAQFSHQPRGSTQRNRGSARRIEMDVPRARVRLSGNAWYTDGRNEVTTAAILYDMKDRSFETERGESEENRVRMTIRPETANKP